MMSRDTQYIQLEFPKTPPDSAGFKHLSSVPLQGHRRRLDVQIFLDATPTSQSPMVIIPFTKCPRFYMSVSDRNTLGLCNQNHYHAGLMARGNQAAYSKWYLSLSLYCVCVCVCVPLPPHGELSSITRKCFELSLTALQEQVIYPERVCVRD